MTEEYSEREGDDGGSNVIKILILLQVQLLGLLKTICINLNNREKFDLALKPNITLRETKSREAIGRKVSVSALYRLQ